MRKITTVTKFSSSQCCAVVLRETRIVTALNDGFSSVLFVNTLATPRAVGKRMLQNVSGNRSHFLNDWMFGFVNVIGGE